MQQLHKKSPPTAKTKAEKLSAGPINNVQNFSLAGKIMTQDYTRPAQPNESHRKKRFITP
jgi:hypothetical protein